MSLEEVWRHHEVGIAEALERCGDPHSVADIAMAVVEGRAQVWGDERALIVTQTIPPFLHFWLATGELGRVLELSREIRTWGRGQGLHRSTLTGRRGWLRALAADGWRERAVLMEVDT